MSCGVEFHDGCPIGGSIAEIEAAAKGARVEGGKRLSNGASQGEVDFWVQSMG